MSFIYLNLYDEFSYKWIIDFELFLDIESDFGNLNVKVGLS